MIIADGTICKELVDYAKSKNVEILLETFEEHALVFQLIENQTSVIAELEKIKAEIEKDMNYYWIGDGIDDCCVRDGLQWAEKIIDKHIKELKGKNNES